MSSDSRVNDVAAYAAAVRGALGDLPPDERVALLEDLEDHLAEIAAEAEGSLMDRLGPAEQYAAELRAAYGATHPAVPVRQPRLHKALASFADRVTDSAWYRDLTAFLPSLRPAWWVFRAYILVLIVIAAFSSGDGVSPIPNPFSSRGLLQLIATAAAIVVSVRLGQRGRPHARNLVFVAVAANVAIALLAIPMLASMSTYRGGPVQSDISTGGVPAAFAGGPTTNIYAYSRDGKPLKDVLLYDQDGRPLMVGGQGPDVTTSYPVGADGLPITNAYPLTQKHADGTPVAAPRVAIPPWPTASPGPTPSTTP